MMTDEIVATTFDNEMRETYTYTIGIQQIPDHRHCRGCGKVIGVDEMICAGCGTGKLKTEERNSE
jgi:ribosomal protein L37E